MTLPPFFTFAELHDFIGKERISERALYEAIRRGDIPSLRVGRRVLIPSAPIERLLEQAAHLSTGRARGTAR